ncbi:hypothetical protein GGI11_008248 [Coemansia sp. RSA 2049]|nr:hypothetical protein GGI11_008248 [Coemansia sp. RSA 2049]
MEPFASKTVQIAYMLAGISPESAISVTRSVGRSAMEHATEHIWHLGLEHPESGLVPTSDYDQIVTLQFINIWSTNILPALVYSPHSPPFADLAMVNKWIVSRRSSLSRRGPFWNGRSPCIAEVVVAPFADALLHGNSFIPDTQECSAVSSWLAAVRCMPFTRLY